MNLAMTMLSMLQAEGAIRFLVGFIVFVVVVACVIVLVRWLITISGITVPQPILWVLGMIFFLIALMFLLNFTGVYTWGGFGPHPYR
jgi:hypothetical protein